MATSIFDLIKGDIDDYSQSISGMIAFCKSISKSDECDGYCFFIGRRMETSEDNHVTKKTEVTPDLVVQVNPNYGIIAEAKLFPMNQDYWEDAFLQIKKYDDNLRGWRTPTEYIIQTDLVLLTQYKLKTIISDYIDEKILNEEMHFDRPFSLVTYNQTERRGKQYILLEKGYGQLSNPEINERLRSIDEINAEEIVSELSLIKFYDVEPPLPYTAYIVWEYIFPQLISQEKFMESKGKKITEIIIDVGTVTRMLKEQFTRVVNRDSRQPEIPKTAWITSAIDKLIEWKYGYYEKTTNKRIIKYKKIKDPLGTFIKAHVKEEEIETTQEQLDKYVELE